MLSGKCCVGPPFPELWGGGGFGRSDKDDKVRSEVPVRNFIRFAASFVLGLGAVALLGCTNDDEDNNSNSTTKITEIDADDSTIVLGEGTVVRFNFLFDEEDIFDDDGQVELVVKLPNQLTYQTGSAEIDGFSAQDDEGVTPEIVRCDGGVTYLVFDLDSYDLDEASPPSDDADAQLTMTINGRLLGDNITIEARADEGSVSYGCDEDFSPDEDETVSVVLLE